MRKIIYLAIFNLLLCKPTLNNLENNINNQTNLISNHYQFFNDIQESNDRTNNINVGKVPLAFKSSSLKILIYNISFNC